MQHESPLNPLPDGLPPGRLVTPERGSDSPVMWVSDQRLPDAGRHWRRLFELRDKTGLYPLLLDPLEDDSGRPWHDGELNAAPIGAIDALTAENVLIGFWNDGPLGPWPGLAPPGVPCGDPGTAAALLAESLGSARPRLLGLVPATRGADTLTLCGWTGPCNHTNETEEISVVVRSWEERFGVRVVTVGYSRLELSVAAPPTTLEHARQVAAEHEAFSPDTIWQGCGDFEDYAEALIGSGHWSFWWD
jgi:hypothetical protein